MKNVLVLGSGLVAKPLVEYLLKSGFFVTVASKSDRGAAFLAQEHKNGTSVKLDIRNTGQLGTLIKKNDVVVSLMPYIYHLIVTKLCIEHKKSLVTASYVGTEMRALDSDAKKAGILVLNEMGLDPGIDHMSAMKIIHEVQKKGGKVESFRSFCGGLPSPDANDNPWGYKFSWSPRGVVMAAKNGALYLKDGKQIKIAAEKLFSKPWQITVPHGESFEAYPNRDSCAYIDLYGLKDIQTMIRGTLRNKGWCETWGLLARLNFFDDRKEYNFSKLSYASFMRMLTDSPGQDPKKALVHKLDIRPQSTAIHNFEWIGLFSKKQILMKRGTAIDLLVDLLGNKLKYASGEQDMTVLYHDFEVSYKKKRERITSELVDYGVSGGDSSMSRTVGLPAAIGARLILEEKIKLKGIQIPVVKEIYEPVLQELEKFGIVCREEKKTI